MSEVIQIEPHHHRTWRAHWITLAVFAVVPAAMTVRVWTTEDPWGVRPAATLILWSLYAAVALVSSLGVVGLTRWTRRRAIAVAVPWAVTLGVLAVVISLLVIQDQRQPPSTDGPGLWSWIGH